ncbi:hypothetical protein GCM10010329_30000 [Streptomyces spiroverticillatus]|uniref:Uncharacterized protein n=1 Tax=Streptomyces finlayi TaxID=67296 RepID=A0A919C986_9ACTN|nr:hypothetical protein [Streptomyces finlayi]GHA05545.1 hypothetical protein GCM10010329_30000 [Streptomyces spiroverticillatus]GHC89398.1 hypothetical protein GCM10010334_22410 [Streptomyces finlayi]
MHDERLAEFSRERLDGRPLPEDLRTLLVAQWEGRTDFLHLLDLDFFETGEVHPLLDTSYLRPEELADPELQSVNAAAAEMARHVKLVAKGGKGWLGYWLHPDEPADPAAWRLVELDTEFSFWSLSGRTLTEGVAAERAHYRDEPDERAAFAQLADEVAALGMPLTTRDYDSLDETEYTVDPAQLMDALIDAERAKRGLG